MAAGKLLGDIRRAGKRLRLEAGLDAGAGVGFETRWPSVRDSVVQAFTDGTGFDDAVCRVGDFVTALSVETGGRFGAGLRSEFSYPRIEDELRGALDESGLKPTPRVERSRVGTALRSFWFGHQGPEDPEAVPAFARALEERLGRGLFEALWERGVLGATLTQVEIEVRLAENR